MTAQIELVGLGGSRFLFAIVVARFADNDWEELASEMKNFGVGGRGRRCGRDLWWPLVCVVVCLCAFFRFVKLVLRRRRPNERHEESGNSPVTAPSSRDRRKQDFSGRGCSLFSS